MWRIASTSGKIINLWRIVFDILHKTTYIEIKTTSLSKLITKLVNPRIHEAQLLAEDRKCLWNRIFEIQHIRSKLKICSLKLWKTLFATGITKNWNEVGQQISKIEFLKMCLSIQPERGNISSTLWIAEIV
jgi:hypothetical protein